MKITKLIKGALVAMLITTGLSAGIVQQDGNGIQWNKLYFDYGPSNNLEFLELINSSDRKGLYLNDSDLNRMKSFPFVLGLIRATVFVPSEWAAKDIFLESKYASKRLYSGPRGATNISHYIDKSRKIEFKGNTNKLKVQKDKFGNHYAEFYIYFGLDTDGLNSLVATLKDSNYKIANAQKKRAQDYEWEPAQFFVTE